MTFYKASLGRAVYCNAYLDMFCKRQERGWTHLKIEPHMKTRLGYVHAVKVERMIVLAHGRM